MANTVQIHHSPITTDNIEIYGQQVESDSIGAGYNIGDLLNMPSLGGFWQATPHNTPGDLERLYHIGSLYPGSILHYYIEARPVDEIIPYEYRVMGAVDKFIGSFPQADWFSMVSEDDVLCVHIRCGDKEVEDDFIRLIIYQSQFYRQVFLFSGLHLDERFASNLQKKQCFQSAMNRLLELRNVSLVLAPPDEHISMMRNAKNLLLHKGGFSAIGAIVCKGNVFITKYMDVINAIWKSKIKRTFIHLPLV